MIQPLKPKELQLILKKPHAKPEEIQKELEQQEKAPSTTEVKPQES